LHPAAGLAANLAAAKAAEAALMLQERHWRCFQVLLLLPGAADYLG
jgi:hypothetical protein